MDKTVFLGLGTNLGDRENNLLMAVKMIREEIGSQIDCSSVYETEPWGFLSDKPFLNMVVRVTTSLKPREVLEKALMIEARLGRLRGVRRYISRTMDIDILLYGTDVIRREYLEIPHPKIAVRRFVLEPLRELAPEMIHPVLKVTFSELLMKCMDKCTVSAKHPFPAG